DAYEWAYTKNARYSVRSGYWVATHVNLHDDETVTPPKGSVALKTKIWKLNITPKIRHFLWKCLSGAIATTTQLITRTIPADPVCQRCCKEDETINHILFTCPFAKAVWRHVHGTGQHYLSDYLEDNMRSLLLRATISSFSQSQRLLPFWIVWRLWRSRNDFLFRKITRTPQSEATKGTNEATEWLDANINSEVDNNSTSPRTTPSDKCSRWSPPPIGWLKCNFDSGYKQGQSFTNTGWVIRNSDGKVLLSGCAKLSSSTSALQAEALGFLHVLHVTWSHGMRQIWFESDSKELTSIINKCEDHSQIGTLLQDIRYWMAKLPLASLDHVNRERNSAADKMAHQAITMNSLYNVYSVPPSVLIPYLYQPYTI
ncbi:unnamed protein product, partial [Arabidopsis halleri]